MGKRDRAINRRNLTAIKKADKAAAKAAKAAKKAKKSQAR